VFSCVDYYASKETFDLGECKDCGFLFTMDFPTEDEIGIYYDTKDYISHSNTKEGLVNKVYHKVRSFMLKKKQMIVSESSQSENNNLLDIGCGTGFFLNQMKNAGWNVSGIEKNEQARTFVLTNFNIPVLEPNRIQELKSNSFGVITLWHVLEHLEHLNESLRQYRDLLADDGTLIIAVPNVSSADAAVYKEYWAAYDVPRHLWHFSSKTMKLLAKNNGFKITKLFPMPFDAFYVSMLSEKYKGNKFSFISGLLIGSLCWIQSISKKSKSSSIIYILKKV
jgi:2-polyprenyl-3-methyl-5-hydroxy-6-metoxy-1,4-benzoquinol methylase